MYSKALVYGFKIFNGWCKYITSHKLFIYIDLECHNIKQFTSTNSTKNNVNPAVILRLEVLSLFSSICLHRES